MTRNFRALCALTIVSMFLVNCSDDKGTGPEKPPALDLTAYGLVSVPGTSGYPMGYSGVAEPVHIVSLDSFEIGKHEVTYELWAGVRDWALAHGYAFAGSGRQGSNASTSTAQHPVTMITWRDCIAWCNAASEKEGLTPMFYNPGMDHIQANVYRNSASGGDPGNADVEWSATGFRLPTEAEWEYAARYIDGASLVPGDQHCGYNIDAVIGDCAWYSVNSGASTHPVGELQPNSLGLKDMSGNVWEFCWDWSGTYGSSSEDNPHGPTSGTKRVIRGGSYNFGASDCRSALRASEGMVYGYPDDGFRICRSGS